MIRAEAQVPGQQQSAPSGIAIPGAGISGNGQDQASGSKGGAIAQTVFVAELAYAGVFTLSNLPEQAIELDLAALDAGHDPRSDQRLDERLQFVGYGAYRIKRWLLLEMKDL